METKLLKFDLKGFIQIQMNEEKKFEELLILDKYLASNKKFEK